MEPTRLAGTDRLTSSKRSCVTADGSLPRVDSGIIVRTNGTQGGVDILPVVRILGPPGCGKRTLSKRLAEEYDLYHLSVGDWLRAQTKAPIAGVSDNINEYISTGKEVPEDVLIDEYSHGPMPPALTRYQCQMQGKQTPSDMWLHALPDLRVEFERSSNSEDAPAAILLDGFPRAVSHAQAAEDTFGYTFPNVAISVECSEQLCRARFLARGRGNNNAAVHQRRFARFSGKGAEVIRYYEKMGRVVKTNTYGSQDDAYDLLENSLHRNRYWNVIITSVPVVLPVRFSGRCLPTTLIEEAFCEMRGCE